MMTTNRSRSMDPAVAVVAVGAILAIIGVFLPWGKESFHGQSVSAKGWDGWEGKTVLILAAFMVFRAFLAGRGGRRGLAVLVMIGGAVIAGIAIYDMATFKSSVID